MKPCHVANARVSAVKGGTRVAAERNLGGRPFTVRGAEPLKQTGPSKWKPDSRGVDEVEDLIGGEAAGICGGVVVRWRSRPVRRGGGGGVWGGCLPRGQGKSA